VRNGKEETVEWSEVIVGDICKVEENDFFPADLILLASSAEGGSAFIETASLDGEKNLKPRNAYPRTQMYHNLASIGELKGELEGIIPDKELH
jgi:P-type E1-E2 ATPase